MPTRKNRIISLRLSEEEYESLKSRYASHGVRSLSEFARDAMHRMLGDNPDKPTNGADIQNRVQVLDGKLAVLETEVSRLSRAIELDVSARKSQ
jgi:hypothetical protein